MARTVEITERRGLGIASVMARRGVDAVKIETTTGLTLPSGPGRLASGDLAWVGTGPGAWLAVTEAPTMDWPEPLERQLDGVCAVSDQSGSYRVFRLSGYQVRELLQRGAAVDLHPSAFGQGASTVTSIAHIGVILWRPDDGDTFDVAVFRSFSGSFRHWLNVTIETLAPSAP